ncbi:MAG: outer membrane beta-barrel protein [Chryseolinea sp.]
MSERLRLWQFLEDELKTTGTAVATWQHKFDHPGRVVNVGVNYTFHREDEKYYFTNTLPTYVGLDSFKLISDEHVGDFSIDYVQPLRYGKFETGVKFRSRYIPTNMQFIPGLNSPLDVEAGGWATYEEAIPALYGNYIFERNRIEVEAGIRVEYVRIIYKVNPDHNTYESDGYHYTQPFPNLRFAYKPNGNNGYPGDKCIPGPDVIPQGKSYSRFYIDLGVKKTVQSGRGEIFLNATDLANTLRVKRETTGNGFRLVSTDYYEAQVVRFGYNYKF